MALKQFIQRIWSGSESRATLTSPSLSLAEALTLGTSTAAGVTVTPEAAMTSSAVAACVRVIAESIASLPVHIYERSGDGRRRVRDEPLVWMIENEPNRIMSSFTLRETMMAHALVWGNAYAIILRDGAGRPTELLPVVPHGVRVRKAPAGTLVYDFWIDSPAGNIFGSFDQANVIHVPGLAFDGITGISPIRYAARAIGLSIAAETFGAALFGNSSMPAGYIKLAEKLTSEQISRLRESWYSAYGGLANANKTAVLFGGAEFQRISIPPNEAQFLETRRFQVAEIARWYRVPLHMIGDLERATFSNIEHQSTDFVVHTLRPWLTRLEQEFNRKLFPSDSETNRPASRYLEFNVDGLLRGDVKTRGDYYVRGRQWGWLSANDIRRLENMEPIENGDVYLSPLNMVEAGSQPTEIPADASGNQESTT